MIVIDVGVDELGVPGVGVGDRVDVVPAAGVEADEVASERGADLHQLKARLDLLDQHVTEDRSALEAEMVLERVEQEIPIGRLGGGLDLRQVQHDRAALLAQRRVIVGDIENEVGDRRREPAAVVVGDMPIIEMQPARSEDPGGRAELLAPVRDRLVAEEPLGPGVHLAGDLLGDRQELRVLGDHQLEVALVVQRHRLDLSDARPRRRTSSRRRRRASRRRRCAARTRWSSAAWSPARCPGSTGAAGRGG